MTTLDPVPGGRPGDVALAGELSEQLASQGVAGVVLSWVDTAGINRIKAIPVTGLVSAVSWGVGMSPVFDTMLSDGSLVSTDLAGGPQGDLRHFPDLDALVVLAAQPGWAWAPIDRLTQDGEVHAGCSRSLLRRLVADLAGHGVTFRASVEIEFALGLSDAPPAQFEPACTGPAYGMTRLVEQSDFCADALAALAEQGVDVHQLHPEYAAGQYEVSVGALDPVGAADRSVLVRQTLRAVARNHGLLISFAPSVVAGGVGSGGHIHLSAWRDGENLHAVGDGPLGMTPYAQSFVAGIIAELPALSALLSPSPSSYLRLLPSNWSGAYACWGHENREAAVRLVAGMVGNRDRAANVEIKSTDLAANPYLALAGLLAAGTSGVQRSLPLGDPVDGDPAALSDAERARLGIRRLPTDLSAAADAFEASPVLRQALGDLLAGAVVAVRRGEVARVAEESPENVARAFRWVY